MRNRPTRSCRPGRSSHSTRPVFNRRAWSPVLNSRGARLAAERIGQEQAGSLVGPAVVTSPAGRRRCKRRPRSLPAPVLIVRPTGGSRFDSDFGPMGQELCRHTLVRGLRRATIPRSRRVPTGLPRAPEVFRPKCGRAALQRRPALFRLAPAQPAASGRRQCRGVAQTSVALQCDSSLARHLASHAASASANTNWPPAMSDRRAPKIPWGDDSAPTVSSTSCSSVSNLIRVVSNACANAACDSATHDVASRPTVGKRNARLLPAG